MIYEHVLVQILQPVNLNSRIPSWRTTGAFSTSSMLLWLPLFQFYLVALYLWHTAVPFQALDTAGGFSNTDNEDGYRAAVRALKQVRDPRQVT